MKLSRGRMILAGLVLVAASSATLVLPTAGETILRVALVALFGLALVELSAQSKSLRSPKESYFDRPRTRRPPQPERPRDLVKLERTLGWRAYDRQEFVHRVRPLLRRLVGVRLQERHGIDLGRHPDRARAVLAPELAEIVVSPTGEETDLPDGVDAELVDRLLAQIEAI